MKTEHILVTGGSGLLGGELKKLLPGAMFPSSSEMDVRDASAVDRYLSRENVKVVLHAAAAASPPQVEKDPTYALECNIVGTANVVAAAMRHQVKLVYISTDYVFPGDSGNYREEDALHPINRYAWSKLGGECAVRLYDNSLIIRTTFGPAPFPHPKAFVDQWTSRETAGAVAQKIVKLLQVGANGTVHVGGARRTVYEFAQSIRGDREIGKMSAREVDVPVPHDTSLCCERYEALVKG